MPLNGLRKFSTLLRCLLILVWLCLSSCDDLSFDSRKPSHDSMGAFGMLPKIFLSENCKSWRNQFTDVDSPVFINGAAILELAPSKQSTEAVKCSVTFRTLHANQRLLLHFESVDINFNPSTVDRLHVYDGSDEQYSKQLTPNRGIYGRYYKGVYEFSSGGIHDYRSSGASLTVSFDGAQSPDFSGFQALLTVFTDTYINGQCEPNYLKCNTTNICIPNVFHCDGYQHCGDDDKSNFKNCNSFPHHNYYPLIAQQTSADLGLMVGCAISIVVLMVVLIWLGIICLKRTKLNQHRRRHMQQGPNDVDGTVVEPVEPRRLLAPFLSHFEPPPVYSEGALEDHCGATPSISMRFEPPPPYTVDDRDTAQLLCNENSAPVHINTLTPYSSTVNPSTAYSGLPQYDPLQLDEGLLDLEAEPATFVLSAIHERTGNNSMLPVLNPDSVNTGDNCDADHELNCSSVVQEDLNGNEAGAMQKSCDTTLLSTQHDNSNGTLQTDNTLSLKTFTRLGDE